MFKKKKKLANTTKTKQKKSTDVGGVKQKRCGHVSEYLSKSLLTFSLSSSLASCNLTGVSCKILASVLQSSKFPLGELDLTNNDLSDGVLELSPALSHRNCKLHTLMCVQRVYCIQRFLSLIYYVFHYLHNIFYCQQKWKRQKCLSKTI